MAVASIAAALPLHLGLSSPCSPSSYEHGLQASGLVKSGPVCRVGVVGDACKGVKSWRVGAVRGMAPDEEKMTRRSPLDFPIEWDRPRPGRRADIFPQFSPMKTPLPPPLPADPPEEDEEEEEKKEEEEENPDEPEKPDVSF
ncbi:uncharacterized protein [Physcomitrium patens]|uniref:Uncharacterized protein n=1 Tax=Physcomitrium patens TaxID=3218 RepID=A0A2K1LB54_PHYPA|nr:uncharacterized protein LOC112294563 [Physcomitrium patens]PNR63260.1 hypothetical protein PHYPA_001685 [Physcomitrium patens]|eukprot:XP_024401338.1 uncharacterized protein LOC112294563 [Physcomitrella patens]